MPVSFTTSSCSVGDLFADGKIYVMPEFQRPYSWSDDRAFQLFDDLEGACVDTDGKNKKRSIEAFLGAIILVDQGQNMPLQVVDGQQRLVTLTTILAVLRDRMPSGEFRESLQRRIERTADIAAGRQKSPRIQLRDGDHEEFSRYVVTDGGTKNAPREGSTKAVTRILDVVARLHIDFPRVHVNFIETLATFILNKCSVVVITAQTLDDAYKLFKSVNNPGEPLSDIAFARAELLGPLVNDPKECARISTAWDELEERVGEDIFRSYVQTVASIAAPDIKGELYEVVRGISRDKLLANAFYSNLRDFVTAYSGIENAAIDIGPDSRDINRHVACLLASEIEEWRGPALCWLMQGPSPQETLRFFRHLDGLCLGLNILRNRSSRVITDRFREITKAVESRAVLQHSSSPLFLKPEERRKIVERLTKPIKSGNYLKPLLLRLNAEATPKEYALQFPQQVEIEHILPQKPRPTGEWTRLFPDPQEREQLTYLIGNMTLLTSKRNKEIANADFATKKDKVLSLDGNNSLAINSNVIGYKEWDREAILRRHEDLVRKAAEVMSLY
jgi:hypothetical protein